EDGVLDIYDNCPFDPNPDQNDTDRDSVGDACDGHPNEVLLVRPVVPALALSERPLRATYRLEDGSGALRVDLTGGPCPLQAQGAVFGADAVQGRLISGGGTSSALVEFVDGLVTLDVVATNPDTVSFEVRDTAKLGLVAVTGRLERFESDDGGLAPAGIPGW